MKRLLLAIVATVYTLPAASEPIQVSLADYAFDFATYGYEIAVTGETGNFSDKLTADDYITINDNGYTLKTLIDRMSRKDRQQFIAFFNNHCIGFPAVCPIAASGDVELDERMRMIFRMATVTIRKGDDEWSSSAE